SRKTAREIVGVGDSEAARGFRDDPEALLRLTDRTHPVVGPCAVVHAWIVAGPRCREALGLEVAGLDLSTRVDGIRSDVRATHRLHHGEHRIVVKAGGLGDARGGEGGGVAAHVRIATERRVPLWRHRAEDAVEALADPFGYQYERLPPHVHAAEH